MGVRKRNLQPVLGHSVEDLVRPDHAYRLLLQIVPFEELCSPLKSKYSPLGRGGYPADSMFKALLLQWMEDLSDRELERFLQENLAGKLFCGFSLTDPTPDFTSFGVMRDRIGTHGLADLFNSVRQALKEAGLVREVFTFVDATNLISKVDMWRERDRLMPPEPPGHRCHIDAAFPASFSLNSVPRPSIHCGSNRRFTARIASMCSSENCSGRK